MIYWVIQDSINNEDGVYRLIEYLQKAGKRFSIHKIIPFTCQLAPEPDFVADRVICISSYAMGRIALARGWKPGVFSIRNITFGEMRQNWGEHLLNCGGRLTTFQEVPSTPEFQNGSFFIRPSVDEKIFNGLLQTQNHFLKWHDEVVVRKVDQGTGLKANSPVIVATPKEIHAEFRTWVIDQRIVTASCYKLGGRTNLYFPVDEEIIAFATERATEWEPQRAYCLDIAKTPDGLKIIELNSISFSGLYNADVSQIVEGLENLVAYQTVRGHST
jgi:hypothetical protein